MKKLLVIMLLMFGTLSFASTGKIIKPMVMPKSTIVQEKSFNLEKSAVWCCTIGGLVACGPVGTNQCGIAMAEYCRLHPCGGGGGCIMNCGGGGGAMN